VVLRWSRTRKQYERQGLLVQEDALAKAEQESLADADVRARRREREAARRVELDRTFVAEFAKRIRQLSQAVRPAAPGRSPSTRVGSSAVASADRRRPNGSMRTE